MAEYAPQHFCVNDYGSMVFRCHWTGDIVVAEDCILSGGYYPGVRMRFIAAAGYEAARKAEKRLFDESEGNCNTCSLLDRVKHDKCIDGFLYGKCKKTGNGIKFHPEDPMRMPCYEGREP